VDNQGPYQLRDLLHKVAHRGEEEETQQDYILEPETGNRLQGAAVEGEPHQEEHVRAGER
jgi:hypothetical protein